MFVLIHVKRLKVEEAVLESLKGRTQTKKETWRQRPSAGLTCDLRARESHLADAQQTVQDTQVEGALPKGRIPARTRHQGRFWAKADNKTPKQLPQFPICL